MDADGVLSVFICVYLRLKNILIVSGCYGYKDAERIGLSATDYLKKPFTLDNI